MSKFPLDKFYNPNEFICPECEEKYNKFSFWAKIIILLFLFGSIIIFILKDLNG